MAWYRKKPIAVEAFRWGVGEVPQWFKDAVAENIVIAELPELGKRVMPCYMQTLEGELRVNVGDYIIKGAVGEIYPCKEKAFLATFEPAEAPDAQ